MIINIKNFRALRTASAFDDAHNVNAIFSQTNALQLGSLFVPHIGQKLDDHIEQVVAVVNGIVELLIANKVELGKLIQVVGGQDGAVGLVVHQGLNFLHDCSLIPDDHKTREKRSMTIVLWHRHQLAVQVNAKQMEQYGCIGG